MKKRFISIIFTCCMALLFAACGNGNGSSSYDDDFDAAEWEKDVTTEIDEIKFSEGTWWFRERYFLTDDPIIQTGEFVITYNGTEMDLQYTKIIYYPENNPSKKKVFNDDEIKYENESKYKINSLDLEECDYTMPSGYAQKVQCFKNAGETKFKSHTVEHALGYSSGELEDIPSDRWFEKIQ